MSLMRWEPMTELDSLKRQMDRLFGSFAGRGFTLPALEGVLDFTPVVEIYETDKEVVINAELPGVDPKRVTVETSDEAIVVSGESEKHGEIKEDNYYRSERQYGSFKRAIACPNRIKANEAKATFKDGLLTIRAPLAEPLQKTTLHKVNVESK